MLSNQFMKFLCLSDEEEKKTKAGKKEHDIYKSTHPLFYILLKTGINKN